MKNKYYIITLKNNKIKDSRTLSGADKQATIDFVTGSLEAGWDDIKIIKDDANYAKN